MTVVGRQGKAFAIALAAAISTMAACSLGLSESQVESGAGGAGASHGPAGPGGGSVGGGSGAFGGGAGGQSTSTQMTPCGDGTCAKDLGENCSTCPADCGCTNLNEACVVDACQACPDTWSTPLPANATHGLVAHGGALFLVALDEAVKLAEADVCTGTLKPLASPTSVPTAWTGFVTQGADGASIVAGVDDGASPGPHGITVVGVEPGPTTAWTRGPPAGELAQIAGIAAAKKIWMGVGSRSAAPQSFLTYGDLGGKHVCTRTTDFGGALGAGVATDGDSLFALAVGGEGLAFATFDASQCDPVTCACEPTQTASPGLVGGDTTQISAMLFANGALYFSGYGSDDGMNFFGYVAKMTPAGLLGTVYRSDPTANLDAFVSLAADGLQIFAGGYEGATAVDDVSDAVGVVAILDFSLVGMAQPSVHPAGSNSVVGIATDPTQPGHFFAALVGGMDPSTIVRCATSGCP